MTDQPITHKSAQMNLADSTSILESINKNGVKCDGTGIANYDKKNAQFTGVTLSWNFNWNELKHSGVDELSGHITVTSPQNFFSPHKIKLNFPTTKETVVTNIYIGSRNTYPIVIIEYNLYPRRSVQKISHLRKEKDYMEKYRKLLSGKKTENPGGLLVNKLANDIHDFCEKTTELHFEFNKERIHDAKNQKESGKLLMDKQNVLEETVKKILDDQNKLATEYLETVQSLKISHENSIKAVLEELRLMRNSPLPNSDGNNIKATRSGRRSQDDSENRLYDERSCSISPPRIDEEKSQPSKGKNRKIFVLKAEFDDILNLSETPRYSGREDHFGTSWFISINRSGNFFSCFVSCCSPNEMWTLDSHWDCKIISSDSGIFPIRGTTSMNEKLNSIGSEEVMKIQHFRSYCVNDGKTKVVVDIEISNVKGVYKKSSRTFDESMQYYDCVLIVEEKMFYIIKLFLSAQSAYFKTRLNDCCDGSDIYVDDVESEDFHVFLGVLYGDDLDETTVEITLLLAEQFDAPTVAQRCEDFLINKSQKTLRKKLQLAIRYNLDKLKKNCIGKINTSSDIDLVSDIVEKEPSILADVMKKLM